MSDGMSELFKKTIFGIFCNFNLKVGQRGSDLDLNNGSEIRNQVRYIK